MLESEQSIAELQHRIHMLEQVNSELVAQNLRQEETIRQLEQNISEMTEMDVLHEVIDEISHDLRLPLGTITNYLYLLKQAEQTPLARRQLDVIDRQVNYLTDVVNNLIHMARLDLDITQFHVKLSPINQIVNTVIDAVQPIACQKQQVITLDLEPDLPGMMVDNIKITRAIMNIAQNAVAYTPINGKIHIRTFADCMGNVVIEVADNGVGISREDLPHIFDRFYRVNPTSGAGGNVGLGLAITKRIVQNHCGRIEVESEVNSGTVFRISLPTLATLRSYAKNGDTEFR